MLGEQPCYSILGEPRKAGWQLLSRVPIRQVDFFLTSFGGHCIELSQKHCSFTNTAVAVAVAVAIA